MKFALVALVAAVSAAAGDKTDDSWKWSVCLKAGDCGDGWICCNATKKADGSDASTGTMICTDPTQNGVVPTTVTSPYKGFNYFCTHKQHKAAVANTTAAAGSTTIAVSACVATASAFLLA